MVASLVIRRGTTAEGAISALSRALTASLVGVRATLIKEGLVRNLEELRSAAESTLEFRREPVLEDGQIVANYEQGLDQALSTHGHVSHLYGPSSTGAS